MPCPYGLAHCDLDAGVASRSLILMDAPERDLASDPSHLHQEKPPMLGYLRA